MLRIDQAGTLAKEMLVFNIDKDIVDVIIAQLLLDYDPDDEEADSRTGNYDNIFTLVDQGGAQHYEATWTNKLQFRLIVSYISVGVSFRQCSSLLQHSKEISGMAALGNISMAKVIRVVRYTCAFNFEIIRNVLSHTWAFSIAMDGGTKASVPYLDTRLRFVVQGKLFNVHFVALPMYQSHTGENTFILISKFMDALCGNWRKKLISVSTDGALNMLGRHHGVVTRLGEVCLEGFYRFWCEAHQLALVVQAVFVQMLNDSFVGKTQRITGHLRRQQNLILTMKTTCPKFVDTRWLSMERLLMWLVKHRIKVVEHMKNKQPDCMPDEAWWIMVYILLDFTHEVNITFRSLQGMTTLVSTQEQLLRRLADTLRREGHVKGPLLSIAPMEANKDTYVKGSYYLRNTDVEEHIQNRETFVRSEMQNLKAENISAYNDILRSLSILYVDAVHWILTLMVKRDSMSRGTNTLPPVLPKNLLDFSRANFGDLIVTQRLRLQESFTKQDILDLENEFKKFKTQQTTSQTFAR